jgi:hypothetical protein
MIYCMEYGVNEATVVYENDFMSRALELRTCLAVT